MKTKMVGYNKDKAEYLIMKRCVKENRPLSVTEYSKKIGFSHDYLSKAARNGKMSLHRAAYLANNLRCDLSEITFDLEKPVEAKKEEKPSYGSGYMIGYRGDIAKRMIYSMNSNEEKMSKQIGWSHSYLSNCRKNGQINKQAASILAHALGCNLDEITFEIEKGKPDMTPLFTADNEKTKTEPIIENTMEEKLLAEIAHEIHVNNELIRHLIELWEQ